MRDALSIKEAIQRDTALGKLNITECLYDSKIEKYFITKYSSKITASELLDIWFEKYLREHNNGAEAYNTHIRKHVKPVLGNIRINDLQVSEISEMQSTYSKTLVNKTVDNIMIPLR